MSGKVVTFGEIMMRLSTPGHLRFTQARTFDVTYAGAECKRRRVSGELRCSCRLRHTLA